MLVTMAVQKADEVRANYAHSSGALQTGLGALENGGLSSNW